MCRCYAHASFLKRAVFAIASVACLAAGVLRYPDGSFESRYPLHADECLGTWADAGEEASTCLLKLRRNLLEDVDCNRVICDNIHTSTPIEFYANQSDWVRFKNLCGHLQELFVGVFDLGLGQLGRCPGAQEEHMFHQLSGDFTNAFNHWIDNPADNNDTPAYANSTWSVLQRHVVAVLDAFTGESHANALCANDMLALAVTAARRLQLLIENVSVTLLLNFYIAQLEHNGRVTHGRNFVHELYGDVSKVRTFFHDIPGKRWDALLFLLQELGISAKPLAMAEIGVEAANTSQRLLQRNPTLSYIGVDPYMNNHGLYEDVLSRLAEFRAVGRFALHRNTSLEAAALVTNGSLDLVFLDARHDYEAVTQDISAWRPKLRPGGILSGHDFSWMFPTVAMAVYRAAFDAPERTIHLAPDGVWWLQL